MGRPARRDFLRLLAGAAGATILPAPVAASAPMRLRASAARTSLVGAHNPSTDVWAYDASVPGPEIRLRQGERLHVGVENLLSEGTTVHWHGIRLPNPMDGVPYVTQPPIAAEGGTFHYAFRLPDAGTYWYHPHTHGSVQVGRGLYGALVVEEENPLRVDRDVVWVLSDWRLDREARIVDDFGNFMDASHAGRIGNTVTVNGAVRERFELRAGERVRLRMINAANARNFALDFRGHDPVVIALDGHPVEPHRPANGRMVLGAAMRADILLDAIGEPGKHYPVVDDFYPRLAYRLLDLAYASGSASGGLAGAPVPELAPNTMPEPDLERAERHRVDFAGGMMGNMPRMAMMRGMAWTINGEAMVGDPRDYDPALTLALGRSYVLELVNDTLWWHPIHLHGHAFRVIRRDGRRTPRREWLDTVLMPPRSRAEIAFVADNPGDWMFHCHILEHMAAGMMAVIRVA